jgi:WS/DGAT/MGAT family acyltransferase
MQQHLERLSAVDASFLANESPTSHMHVGAVTILEGPQPPFEEFLDGLRARLHLVPRYRQKLAHHPGGRPLWVDDPDFNLEYHVRQTALPKPGSEAQLMRLAARVMSQQLDRTKPLWEVWLVEGLDGGRVALISKTHHALIDGVSGVDLATVMFDLGPVPADLAKETEGLAPWTPAPEPSTAELVAGGVAGLARTGLGLAAGAVGALTRPSETIAQAREAAEGIGEILWAGLNPAPETPLNVEIGPHRRFVGVRCELADFKAVKNALGGTVNDVVLAVVAGAIRDWLHARGRRVEGLEMKACVPVSTRSKEHEGLGNQISQVVAPLPIHEADPVRRLHEVSRAMEGIKESRQAVGAETIAGLQDFAPPTILAQASRLNFSSRFYNLLVTNVPGPQFPLYVLGRRMQAVYPVAFLGGDRALAVAVMSYDGALGFGLIADLDALADLDAVAAGISSSLAELVELAGGPAPSARPAQPAPAQGPA